MADRAKVAETAVYPVLVCEATAHRHAVAARGLRLHAVGPRTGGDGDAAPRPLRQLRRLLLASPRSISLPSATAALSMVTPIDIAARNACAMVPPLAGVVQVDIRWVPTARTRHAMPAIMRSSCADWRESRAVRVVSVHMSGDARGWARRLRVLRPDRKGGANLSGARPCPRSSGHTLAARASEHLCTAVAAHV